MKKFITLILLMLLATGMVAAGWLVSERKINQTNRELSAQLDDQSQIIEELQEKLVEHQQSLTALQSKYDVDLDTVTAEKEMLSVQLAWLQGLYDLEMEFYDYKRDLVVSQAKMLQALKAPDEVLMILVTDINSYEVEPHFILDRTGNRDQDTALLLEILSKYVFQGLTLERLPSEEADILRVNLKEVHEKDSNGIYPNPNWANGFFQGSTGGIFTSQTLRETMLQSHLKDWYEGVQFYYEGESGYMFDHVGDLLEDVIMRK